MGFRLNHMKIGPFRLNLSAKKLANGGNPLNSVSFDAGIPTIRLWSQDGTRGVTSIDTPGLGSIRRYPGKRRRKPKAPQQPTQAPVAYDPETGYPPLTYNPNA